MSIEKKVAELRELKRMQEELEAEIKKLQDDIKAVMEEQQTDELRGTDWKVTWKERVTNRFDSTAFKKAEPDLYAQYLRKQTGRTFLVA